MPVVIGYDEAKNNTIRRYNQLAYFSFKDQKDMPHAIYNGYDPGPYFRAAHYHQNDQFQVVLDGEFKIGRHEMTPYCVHFTRAYTPYGPLVSEGSPFTFLVMRAHRDAGEQPLSKHRAELEQMSSRQPWQVTQKVAFPPPESRPAKDVLLNEVPNVKDEQGLAVHTLILKPNVKANAPDPSFGDGQYLVVVKGSFWHDDKEHRSPGLIFVKPHEGPYQMHAGAEGLEALVLNFPQRKPRIEEKTPAAVAGFKKWQCVLCSFAYDEALGMPDEGIKAGTRWEDVPENWICPDCSASKSDFQMVEVA